MYVATNNNSQIYNETGIIRNILEIWIFRIMLI